MILLLFLILLNGFFSLAEVVLLMAKKNKLQQLAEKKNRRAKIVLALTSRPEIFLATVQIAITLIAILTGYFSLKICEPYVNKLFAGTMLETYYGKEVSSFFIIAIVTYATSLIGELIPKRVGIIYANSLALLVAIPMWFIMRAFYPLVWFLSKSSNLCLFILGIKNKKIQDSYTEQEIRRMLVESEQQGNIDEEEHEMIERIFSLGDRNITSLMLHRKHITYLQINDSVAHARFVVSQYPYYDYPVCDGDFDKLKGIVSLKDIYTASNAPLLIKDIMRHAVTIPESVSAYSALEQMRKNHEKTCFVVDEYGSVEGLLTLTHILEGIVGDIPEQGEEKDPLIIKRKDGSYLVDGKLSFYEFLEYFEKSEYHEDEESESDEYDTVAGFVIFRLEHIPKEGEKILWHEFTFEVIDMDGHRIDKLIVTYTPSEKENLNEAQNIEKNALPKL